MSNLVQYTVSNQVAVILMASPPINGMGLPLRTAIHDCYNQAANDPKVDAIVIGSACKVFCAGADISEFGTKLPMTSPHLPELCDLIDAASKPVIAAINGQALGGGLELAMSADYRIAAPQAKFGLPEVLLGLLPGAGGSQRLPRLTSIEVAVTMITSGKPVSCQQALAAGLIDRIHDQDDDFIEAAVAYARELVDNQAPVKNCAGMTVDTSTVPASFFDDFRQKIAAKTRGLFAPEKCIQAIEAACTLPLAEGLQKERALFFECMDTSQARGLQHVFMAERAAGRIPGVDRDTAVRKIEQVAIIGSGTMGGGIAMNFANAGIKTLLLDINNEALEKGLSVIRNNYEISVKRGRLTDDQLESCMALIQGTTSYDDLAGADLVIEAVFEKMEIKKTVFEELDRVCKPGAILASNTSTLDINEIAASTRRPRDVVGLHFFSPANVMKLLEIVRGEQTSAEVLASGLKMAKTIRKTAVVVGVCFGFVGNRMLEPYAREAHRLLLEGATPEQVDRVLNDFGMVMGPFATYDLAGIDIGYFMRQGRRGETSHDPSYQIVGDKLYELGHFGQKTKRGFYLYEGRDKTPDPEVVELCQQLSTEFNIERRTISDEEITERCITSLINEGAKILEQGIAYRPGDIDVIWVYGYGFPPYRGGPMQYADEIGPDKVLDVINRYREQLGSYGEAWFQPAPLLQQLVAEGKKFRDLANS
jgi:3-hydroxyacyl-CoA dehydrogenase